jgi:hypothetical protein
VPVPAGSAVAAAPLVPAAEADPVVIGSWSAPAGPVELAQTPTPTPVAHVSSVAEPAVQQSTDVSGVVGPALATDPLRYVQLLRLPLPAPLAPAGARAAPERDEGHIEVSEQAQPPPQPEAVDPYTLFDVHGPGIASGSGGGSPGAAASSFRYAAIAPAPLQFALPATFTFAPAPSSTPEGALEDAPTTRPG